jgi:hypothetical protein
MSPPPQKKSLDRRRGITAHNSIVTVYIGESSLDNPQHIYLLLHCRVDCKLYITVKIQLSHRPVTIAAIYSPPRHSISSEEYEEYLFTLGPQFLAAGDWNAKHTSWGSRLTTTKGRNLLRAITQQNINFLSTGEPTYWPTDCLVLRSHLWHSVLNTGS